MKKLTRSEYFKLNAIQKLLYNVLCFLWAIPTTFISICKAAGSGIKGFCKSFKNEILNIFTTFRDGDWKTRVSYLIFGFGNLSRGQIMRGLFFLVFEVAFIVYMVLKGTFWLGKFRTLGDVAPGEVYSPIYDTYIRVDGDNSFDILLYGILTILLCIQERNLKNKILFFDAEYITNFFASPNFFTYGLVS